MTAATQPNYKSALTASNPITAAPDFTHTQNGTRGAVKPLQARSDLITSVIGSDWTPWQRRGIANAMQAYGATIGTYTDYETGNKYPGAWQPIYDQNGQRVIGKDGKPSATWKNLRPTANGYSHDRWAHYPGSKPLMLPHWSIVQAVADANGKLNGNEGKADTFSAYAAGIRNAIGFFGSNFVPDDLADRLTRIGVTHFTYHAHGDAPGREAAQHIVDLLADSGITVEIRVFPIGADGHKTDANDAWIAVGFDPAKFLTTLDGLEVLHLTPTPRKVYVRPERRPTTASDSQIRAYAQHGLDAECAIVASTSAGRNNQLYKSSAAIGSLIGARAIDRTSAENALMDAALSIGLKESEARATIRSGIEDGELNPRDLSQLDITPIKTASRDIGGPQYSEFSEALLSEVEQAYRPLDHLPDTIRAAGNKYLPDSVMATLEDYARGNRTGEFGEAGLASRAKLARFGHLTENTIRNATDSGAFVSFGDSADQEAPSDLPEDKSPIPKTNKCDRTRFFRTDLETVKRMILAYAKPKIILNYNLPPEVNAILLDDRQRDPLAIIDPNDTADTEIGDKAETIGQFVAANPEFEEKIRAALAEYYLLEQQLEEARHETSLPEGWTYSNGTEYRACFAYALIAAQPAAARKNSNAALADMIGISEGSVLPCLKRARIANIERKADFPIHYTSGRTSHDELMRQIKPLRQNRYNPNVKDGEGGFAIRFAVNTLEYTIVADNTPAEKRAGRRTMTWPEAIAAVERGDEVVIVYQLNSEQVIDPENTGAGPFTLEPKKKDDDPPGNKSSETAATGDTDQESEQTNTPRKPTAMPPPYYGPMEDLIKIVRYAAAMQWKAAQSAQPAESSTMARSQSSDLFDIDPQGAQDAYLARQWAHPREYRNEAA